MPFFALQVRTGEEGRFLSLAREQPAAIEAAFHWPRRNLRIRRRGTWRDSFAPIFPGYLFVSAERISVDLYRTLKGLPGFVRFLPANDDFVPLRGDDQRLLRYFLSFGDVVGRSVACFDDQRRIRILEGPLKGFEGRIVKVDRRKGRARVRLEMYQDSFEIDFGFNFLEAAPGAALEAGE